MALKSTVNMLDPISHIFHMRKQLAGEDRNQNYAGH